MLRASSRRTVGKTLRDARTGRGIPLEKASDDTRIDGRYLDALERDAPPTEFPGPLYARAFLREYSRYLGLNSRRLVGAYVSAHPEPERPFFGPFPVERRHGGWLAGVLVVASLAALAAIATSAARQDEPEVTPTQVGPPPATSPGIEPTSPEPPPTTTPSAPATHLRLAIRVVDAPSWLQVIRGDRVLLEEVKPPGFAGSFRARSSLDVVVGNAGAVRLTLDGRRLGSPGDPGQVYAATFERRPNGRTRIVPS